MDVFFIDVSFAAYSAPGGDDTDDVVHRGVDDYEQAVAVLAAYQNIAVLLRRVIGVRNGEGEVIPERRRGFLKRDPMLALIRGGLRGVPREAYSHGRNLTEPDRTA